MTAEQKVKMVALAVGAAIALPLVFFPHVLPSGPEPKLTPYEQAYERAQDWCREHGYNSLGDGRPHSWKGPFEDCLDRRMIKMTGQPVRRYGRPQPGWAG